jgi:hypothetical protein
MFQREDLSLEAPPGNQATIYLFLFSVTCSFAQRACGHLEVLRLISGRSTEGPQYGGMRFLVITQTPYPLRFIVCFGLNPGQSGR